MPLLILRAPGTNCDGETAHAFRWPAAAPIGCMSIACSSGPRCSKNIKSLLARRIQLRRRHRSGRIFANHCGITWASRWRIPRGGQADPGHLQRLSDSDPVGPAAGRRSHSARRPRWLGTFRPIRRPLGGLAAPRARNAYSSPGIETMYLPVAHGEGRFVVARPWRREELAAGQLACATRDTAAAETCPQRRVASTYPDNPNGSEWPT